MKRIIDVRFCNAKNETRIKINNLSYSYEINEFFEGYKVNDDTQSIVPKLSNNNTERPRSAASRAAEEPAGPPPTTATSTISTFSYYEDSKLRHTSL